MWGGHLVIQFLVFGGVLYAKMVEIYLSSWQLFRTLLQNIEEELKSR